MMKKSIVTAMVCLLLNAPNVFAQTKTCSLPEVWQKVLQHYPSLNSKKEAIKAQEFRKELIREGFLPDVNVQIQQNYGSVQSLPGSSFPLPGIFTISGSNHPATDHTAGASLFSSAVAQWNFLQFGRQQKKLAAADAAINLSSTLLKQEEWNLLSAASRLYFSALATSASLSIARADTRRLSNLLDLLESQANAGLRPGADTLLLKASVLQSKAKEYDYNATLKRTMAQLGALTGDSSSSISPDTSVFNRFQQTAIYTKERMANHPYLQVMYARIRSAEAEKQVVKKEVYPSISLLAGLGLKGSAIMADGSVNKGLAAAWQQPSATYLAGVGLTWNLASLYQNKTKRAVADHLIAAEKAEKETVQVQLEAQFEAALSGWEEQRQKLLAAQVSLEASKEAYGLYEVRYQSGLLSLIELLQLQEKLQTAETNYVTAVSAYWNELLNQAETLGDPSLILTVIKP